jgi:Cu+-exporting ATPase
VACGQINQFGRLEVEAQRVGMNSTLGQVVSLMAKAQSKKSKIQRAADRYARYFLPAVELAAGLTLLAGYIMGWPDRWLRAVAVLVVACPCPLVLATPATILAAWAVLARRGVMVKSGAAIEQLALCDTLAFDKTGTLTIGRPDLVRFEQSLNAELTGAHPELSAEMIAAMIMAVEASNPHPLAGAIVRGLSEKTTEKVHLLESTTCPGAGVSGLVSLGDSTDPTGILIGNLRLMQENQVEIGESATSFLDECDKGGETPLLVAVNNRIVAHIALADQVRPEAHDAVHDLKHLGFSETVILTGDRPGAAARIGRKVHIKNVVSELTPTQKAAWIQDRHVAGQNVAMVGDGINDAPALAVARVGLAVSRVGANLATEAGDIILMHDPLHSLVRAREVSQAALRILKQNIFLFAFGLNGLAVLLAGLGVLSPLAAAVFHQIGSLAVLCNALRLLAFDQLKWEAIGHRGEALLGQFDGLMARAAIGFWAMLPSPRKMLMASGIIVGAYYAASGVVIVGPEASLVRFRPSGSAEVIGPGLYLGRPWPFEEVHQITPSGWWSAAIEPNMAESAAPEGTNRAWTPRVNPEDTAEGLWLTGDGQILQIEATFHARPDRSSENLARLVRQSADPQELIRAEVEQQLRDMIARTTIDTILSENRKKLVDEAAVATRKRLESAGLVLSDLVIGVTAVQPPKSVIDAFRDSARAQREAETLSLKTQASIESENTANQSAIEQMRRNAASKTEVVKTQAQASADSFRSLVAARKNRPNLTDHRIFWSDLEKILNDRPKILLDVPTGDLYGTNAAKRHLILPDGPLPLGPVIAPDLSPQPTPGPALATPETERPKP